MKRINIRESLLNMDRETDCKYDLTSLYESVKLDDEKKKQVCQYIDKYDIEATNRFLSNEAASQGLMENASDDISDEDLTSFESQWAIMNDQSQELPNVASKNYSNPAEACVHLKEWYDDDWYGDEESTYEYIASKSVADSDGFYTDYTWYRDVDTDQHVFVFGDSDIYKPEQGDFDWTCDSQEEAQQWFDSYTGFEDIDESIEDNSLTEEAIDLSEYKLIGTASTGEPYHIYRKIITDAEGKPVKGVWAAKGFNSKEGEEPFAITYMQALGHDPIESNGTVALARELGKKLLPNRGYNESLNEAGDFIPFEIIPDNRPKKYFIGEKEVPYTSYEEAREHIDEFDITSYRDELNQFLADKGLKYIDVDVTRRDGKDVLYVDIHNGDWKHEHMRLQNAMWDFFINKGLLIGAEKQQYGEDDGSDNYSAEYFFDIRDICFSERPVKESLNEEEDFKPGDKVFCKANKKVGTVKSVKGDNVEVEFTGGEDPDRIDTYYRQDLQLNETIDQSWEDMSFDDQIVCIRQFIKSYDGTKVFEDFAEYMNVDVLDVIDIFTDAEARGDIKVPQRKQMDSEFANDDIYEAVEENQEEEIVESVKPGKRTLDEGWFSDDDFEDDMMHTDIYGGDPMYCRDCGSKLDYSDGYGFCPQCNPQDDELEYVGEESIVEGAGESDLIDTLDIDTARFYVYDAEDNVVSDEFEWFNDAIDFADEHNYPVVKVHRYIRDFSNADWFVGDNDGGRIYHGEDAARRAWAELSETNEDTIMEPVEGEEGKLQPDGDPVVVYKDGQVIKKTYTTEALDEDLQGDLDKRYRPSSIDSSKIEKLLRCDSVQDIEIVTMYDNEVAKLISTDGRIFYLVPSTLSQFDVYDEQESLVATNLFTLDIPNEILETGEPNFIYQIVGGDAAGKYTREEIEALPCFSGQYTKQDRYSKPELVNQPKLDGYVGPMFDGWRENRTACIRYETQEVYDMLSEDGKDLSSKKGTLGNLISSNNDLIKTFTTKEEIINFLIDIEPQCTNKKYLNKVKMDIIHSKNFTRAMQYLYDAMLKGDGLGSIEKEIRGNKYRYAYESLSESYSPEDLSMLINDYQMDYTPENHENIWNAIMNEYDDESLANDVLAYLEDDYNSLNEAVDENWAVFATDESTGQEYCAGVYGDQHDANYWAAMDKHADAEYQYGNFTYRVEQVPEYTQELLDSYRELNTLKLSNHTAAEEELRNAFDDLEEDIADDEIDVDVNEDQLTIDTGVAAFELVEERLAEQGYEDIYTELIGDEEEEFFAEKDGKTCSGKYDFQSLLQQFYKIAHSCDQEEAIEKCADIYIKTILASLNCDESLTEAKTGIPYKGYTICYGCHGTDRWYVKDSYGEFLGTKSGYSTEEEATEFIDDELSND